MRGEREAGCECNERSSQRGLWSLVSAPGSDILAFISSQVLPLCLSVALYAFQFRLWQCTHVTVIKRTSASLYPSLRYSRTGVFKADTTGVLKAGFLTSGESGESPQMFFAPISNMHTLQDRRIMGHPTLQDVIKFIGPEEAMNASRHVIYGAADIHKMTDEVSQVLVTRKKTRNQKAEQVLLRK